MKKINLLKLPLFIAIMSILTLNSCTKLEPKLDSPNSVSPPLAGGAPTPSSLSKVYEQLNQLLGQSNTYAMQEHTTDELMGPTRGTDWDDFGTWRKLHLHTWDGSHNQINDTWNGINGAIFQTTLIAETATGQTKAEAQFLRAYFNFIACDLFGQVQHRPATAAIADLPAVYKRSEAIDAVISELEACIPNLPVFTRAKRDMATQEAAKFLLARAYLNKAVYKQDPTNPAGPYTFAPADMQKVISLTVDISSNPAISLNNNYWDNFTWDNGAKSTENIFVRPNSGGINLVWATCMGNHYSMSPDGWNGFTTLSEFYNSFENADARRSSSIPNFTNVTGRNAGFLIGQQRGPVDKHVGNPIVDLKDRSGNPLIFTPDVSLFFSSESRGIRTNKYPLDPAELNNGGWSSKNEFVFFRFADLRLMKAEAILRGGTDLETPLGIVNNLRSKRSAPALATCDLNALLAERGRELYLEAIRRTDLIRFGKFNKPVDQRPTASSGSKVVFPIPTLALASNPNLTQNTGY